MYTGMQKLPKHLTARLNSELKPGEVAAWVGQPDPAKYMRAGFIIWSFFIPWTAFALFWMAGASGFKVPDFSNGWSFFPLFGLPFLLIGIGGLSAPFWLRRKAANMLYVVTNQRAFSLEGARSYTVRSYSPRQLTRITRKENPDGSGDLVIEFTAYKDSDGDYRQRGNGFYAIPDVREVERLLEKLAADQ
jgi:hypothetical protein